MKASFHLLISSLLCLSLATAGTGAQAELLRAESGASAERINAALQRPEVRARLVAEGVDVSAAEARVAALTDEEVALLATRFDESPAAGNGNAFASVVLVAIAFVVIAELWPFFLVGGVAVAAIKASNRSPG